MKTSKWLREVSTSSCVGSSRKSSQMTIENEIFYFVQVESLDSNAEPQTHYPYQPRPVYCVRANLTTSSSFSSCAAQGPSSSPAALNEAVSPQHPAIAATPKLRLPERLCAHDALCIHQFFHCSQPQLIPQTPSRFSECRVQGSVRLSLSCFLSSTHTSSSPSSMAT